MALRFLRGLTQTQIAEQVGLSQMHVSRVLRQTLAFLQNSMASADSPPCRPRWVCINSSRSVLHCG